MSASISCSERATQLLKRICAGEKPEVTELKALGEQCTSEFFRIVVESLADSFDRAEAEIYEHLMRAWVPAAPGPKPELPARVDSVYVLSRVTLGADIKIVSPILRAMRTRFPKARLVFVANKKSAELFAADRSLEVLQCDYPRSGPMRDRLEFAKNLRRELNAPSSIVVDPDSRITQLGLIPVCDPQRFFHFPSRTAGGETSANLTELVSNWLRATFEASGDAWIAPGKADIAAGNPVASVSLGVGENETKRLGLAFEAGLIAALAQKFQTVYIDRGAGGAEAARVSAAVERSGAAERVLFCEGSFAEFASVIAQSDFYAGYDSAGQHAAAATGTPLVTVFAGAPSDRFRERWSPQSSSARVINADSVSPEDCLEAVRQWLRSLPTLSPGHL